MKKQIISITLCISMVIVSTTAYGAQWSVPYMESANDMGLIESDVGSADAEREMTRGEMASLLSKIYETLVGETLPVAIPAFRDASSPDILRVCSAGIMDGVADDLFQPDGHVTREETFLYYYRLICIILEKPEFVLHYSFADWWRFTSFEREYAAMYLYANEILSGTAPDINYEGALVSPDEEITVEQAVTLAVRLAERMPIEKVSRKGYPVAYSDEQAFALIEEYTAYFSRVCDLIVKSDYNLFSRYNKRTGLMTIVGDDGISEEDKEVFHKLHSILSENLLDTVISGVHDTAYMGINGVYFTLISNYYSQELLYTTDDVDHLIHDNGEYDRFVQLAPNWYLSHAEQIDFGGMRQKPMH